MRVVGPRTVNERINRIDKTDADTIKIDKLLTFIGECFMPKTNAFPSKADSLQSKRENETTEDHCNKLVKFDKNSEIKHVKCNTEKFLCRNSPQQ